MIMYNSSSIASEMAVRHIINEILEEKLDVLLRRIIGLKLDLKQNDYLQRETMTLSEVAEYLSVSKVTIHNWVKTKDIESFKKGNQRLFKTEHIKSFYDAKNRRNNKHLNLPKINSPYYQELLKLKKQNVWDEI